MPNKCYMHCMSDTVTKMLWPLCERLYFPQNLRIQSPDTKRQYRFAINDFRRFLCHEPELDDLRKPVLIGFLRWLRETMELAPRTANERAGRVRALWQWCCEEELVPRIPPRNIRLPVPERIPTSWTVEQLRTLFGAASEMPGQVSGVDAGLWWSAHLLWLWNTGERIGATLALRWEHLQGNVATIPAEVRKGRQKTGIYRLWPETVLALEHIRSASPLVFGWDRCEGSYYLHWNHLLRIAGLPGGRNRKAQAMRVSHATWLQIRGHDPTASLGHASAATTKKSYIDTRLTVQDADLPRL